MNHPTSKKKNSSDVQQKIVVHHKIENGSKKIAKALEKSSIPPSGQ